MLSGGMQLPGHPERAVGSPKVTHLPGEGGRRSRGICPVTSHEIVTCWPKTTVPDQAATTCDGLLSCTAVKALFACTRMHGKLDRVFYGAFQSLISISILPAAGLLSNQ